MEDKKSELRYSDFEKSVTHNNWAPSITVDQRLLMMAVVMTLTDAGTHLGLTKEQVVEALGELFRVMSNRMAE